MQTRVFDHMHEQGITELFHYDGVDDTFTIETVQDVEPIIDLNRRLFNDAPETGRFKGDMKQVASIPLPLYYDLKAKGIIDDPARLKAWLNDRDNQLFRTTPGRV